MERRRSFDGQRKPREKVYLDRIALRERLDAVGLTPEEASERMGFNPTYLNRVLRGGWPVSRQARQALQRVLGRDVAATDVRATLPEGPARRGFKTLEILEGLEGKAPAPSRLQKEHRELPDFQDTLTLPDQAQGYFGAGYHDLNRALRLGHPMYDRQGRMLRGLLSSVRPLRYDQPLYRGILLTEKRGGDRPDYAPVFSRGQTLTALEPLSTSTTMFHLPFFARTEPVARREARETHPLHRGSVVFEIHDAAGQPAIVTNPSEQEVMLGPGRRLIVLHSEPRVRLPSWSYDPERNPHLVDEWVVAEVQQ